MEALHVHGAESVYWHTVVGKILRIDMCTEMRIDMCKRVDMSIDKCTDMCMEMLLGTCVQTCA